MSGGLSLVDTLEQQLVEAGVSVALNSSEYYYANGATIESEMQSEYGDCHATASTPDDCTGPMLVNHVCNTRLPHSGQRMYFASFSPMLSASACSIDWGEVVHMDFGGLMAGALGAPEGMAAGAFLA